MTVDNVPETGRHFSLSADAAARAAIAEHIEVRSVEQLEATFELTRQGQAGLHVSGEVKGVIGQLCVVTLEPIASTIAEAVDVDFRPAPAMKAGAPAVAPTGEDDADPPEFLVDGTVDLGALAVEFLILGIDPYPRKPGAKFVAPPTDVADDGPFAALAKLKPDSPREK